MPFFTLPKVRPGMLLAAASLALSSFATAQLAPVDPDWKEQDAPPPPGFELKRLVPFDVSPNSSLKWGFDPETMKIGADSIVRYVVVAQSPSGTVNAMYEAVRCSTGEIKVYARYNKDSGWAIAKDPQWNPMRSQVSTHALRLANQGMCTGAAPASTVREVVKSVSRPDYFKP
jgi:hypothetical protein